LRKQFIVEDQNRSPHDLHTDDELGGLIRQALVDRVAGAEPRQSRAAFLASIRAQTREQALQAVAAEDSGDLEPQHTPRPGHAPGAHIGQAISQFTGPIINLIR
jgi:hypothetical protein